MKRCVRRSGRSYGKGVCCMRKALISALMIALLTLPGCGGRKEQMEKSFESLRQAVTMAERVEAQVELSAN